MQMPLAFNIGRNPHLLSLVTEALESLELTRTTIEIEYDMGRRVGYSEVVATKENDTVFYARQSKTSGFTRFVKNRQAIATQHITICLKRDDEGDYEMENVWIGELFPAAPGEANETPSSKDFWTCHAVVFNGQSLISTSLTKTCPY